MCQKVAKRLIIFQDLKLSSIIDVRVEFVSTGARIVCVLDVSWWYGHVRLRVSQPFEMISS